MTVKRHLEREPFVRATLAFLTLLALKRQLAYLIMVATLPYQLNWQNQHSCSYMLVFLSFLANDINVFSGLTMINYDYSSFMHFFLRPDHVFALDDYFGWFKQSVMRWLDIAQVKAKERIRKAVEVDKVCSIYRACALHSADRHLSTVGFLLFSVSLILCEYAWAYFYHSILFAISVMFDVVPCLCVVIILSL